MQSRGLTTLLLLLFEGRQGWDQQENGCCWKEMGCRAMPYCFNIFFQPGACSKRPGSKAGYPKKAAGGFGVGCPNLVKGGGSACTQRDGCQRAKLVAGGCLRASTSCTAGGLSALQQQGWDVSSRSCISGWFSPARAAGCIASAAAFELCPGCAAAGGSAQEHRW